MTKKKPKRKFRTFNRFATKRPAVIENYKPNWKVVLKEIQKRALDTREISGLKQLDLAKPLNKTTSAISDFETREGGFQNLKALMVYSKLCGVSMDYLCFGGTLKSPVDAEKIAEESEKVREMLEVYKDKSKSDEEVKEHLREQTEHLREQIKKLRAEIETLSRKKGK